MSFPLSVGRLCTAGGNGFANCHHITRVKKILDKGLNQPLIGVNVRGVKPVCGYGVK
jgi:hypothetical protein